MEIEFYKYGFKYFFQNKSNGDEGQIVMAKDSRGGEYFLYVDYVELEETSDQNNNGDIIDFYEGLFEKHLDVVLNAGKLSSTDLTRIENDNINVTNNI